jgi:hypothetical protein
MTGKAHFDAEEWAALVDAPIAAATAVITASPGGTLRETLSLARGYQQARETRPIGLLRELLQSAPSVTPAQIQSHPDARGVAVAALRRAMGILGSKAEPEEIEDYRGFVRWLAETVANAHKEGGFLGIGGQRVSPAEQEALDAIEAALT